MATNSPATPILNGNPIRNRDSADPGETAWADEIKGGHHQKETLAERDAITTERRKKGMTCRVTETGITYVLNDGITNEHWEDVLDPANARMDGIDEVLPTKASRDLTDAVSEAVTNRLLAPAVVTIDKLDASVRSSLSGGLDPALLQGTWNAATNTPTIPAAAGNNGKWYYVTTAGVATGNAPGTYVVGDRIVSNGTSWLHLKVPATVIPDYSIPPKAMAQNDVRDDSEIEDGTVIVRGWSTEGNEELVVGFDADGRIYPDPAAAVSARVDAMEPLTEYLEPGGIPQDRVANTEIWEEGAWIMDGEDHVHLPRASVTEDGTEIVSGFAADGTRYPRSGGGTSNYEPPDYIIFGQDGGGLGISDESGERTIIDDGATWRDMQPTETEGVWNGRSNRFGFWGMQTVNILIPAVMPRFQGVVCGFGGTGQSLDLGAASFPILSTAPVHPEHNLMFNGGSTAGAQGVIIDPADMASFVPMIETANGSCYESPWSGCFNRLNTRMNSLMGGRIRIHFSNHARGGMPYTSIKKGTRIYNNGLYEITRAKALANAAGWDYVYLATMMIHGENDRLIGTSAATYDANLKELLADLTTDIKAITRQDFDPILVTDGCHSWTAPAYGFTDPTVTEGQLSAAMTNSRIIMVGPKYILPYGGDGIHLTNIGSRRAGEYHANSLAAVLFGGGRWNPFAPIEIGQTSDTVWARMQTPLGHSLVLDTSLVTDPGNYGFEVAGGSIAGTPTIDGDRVVIPKSGTITQLRYAYTGIAGNNAGPTTGPRGCLRDTDPAVSIFDSTALHNYCNTFSETVPPAP